MLLSPAPQGLSSVLDTKDTKGILRLCNVPIRLCRFAKGKNPLMGIPYAFYRIAVLKKGLLNFSAYNSMSI